ncbi:MAG: hypothetical protein QGF46_04100 [Planctomycetota bacterium]|jgi:hypothetical protein|nr:hypothetical protein [Planctomycetota bacterium]
MSSKISSALLVAVISFCLINVIQQNCRLLGQDAFDSYRCFNLFLDFNRANLEEDYLLMHELALKIEDLSGQSDAIEFSAYVAGYSTSAKSHQRLNLDALHWAQEGADWLELSVMRRDQPWQGVQLAAYIYLERILPKSKSELKFKKMTNNFEAWLACGGGPDAPSPLTGLAYQEFISIAKKDRDDFIIELMDRQSAPR